MPKPQTRADLILSEARQRITEAEVSIQDLEEDLSAANAVLQAHRDTYAALEKALTPKPRKRATPAAQASLPTDKDPICGLCGNIKDFQDHSEPSPQFHEFVEPKAKKAKTA